MMLIGHVSDEQDMALADVVCEFQRAADVTVVRSASSGAIYAARLVLTCGRASRSATSKHEP